MRTTLPALLAVALLAAPTAVLAQYPNMQPPPPTPATISHEWAGSTLRYTPSTAQGCRMDVVRVFVRSGTIFATMRNAGTNPRNLALNATLAGGNNSKGGNGTGRLAAGQTADVQLMTPYGGSLDGSTMTLRVTACSSV